MGGLAQLKETSKRQAQRQGCAAGTRSVLLWHPARLSSRARNCQNHSVQVPVVTAPLQHSSSGLCLAFPYTSLQLLEVKGKAQPGQELISASKERIKTETERSDLALKPGTREPGTADEEFVFPQPCSCPAVPGLPWFSLLLGKQWALSPV